jgi:hypothetical protein
VARKEPTQPWLRKHLRSDTRTPPVQQPDAADERRRAQTEYRSPLIRGQHPFLVEFTLGEPHTGSLD